jgi:hypothetical protein
MNRLTRRALSGLAILAVLLAGFAAFDAANLGAQVATPPLPSTGSPVVGTLVSTDPVQAAACSSYNTFAYNYTNGNITPCVNGVNGVPSLHSGVTTNTDLAGSVTLSGGAGSYTFKGTYASAPFCIAGDSTAAAATKASATTTTLTLAGTTTDVLKYICVVTK